MYSPKYTITHLILNYIVKYELAIERIKNTPIPQTYFKEIYDKVHAEDIDKLGQIIGQQIGYSNALNIQRGKYLITSKTKTTIFTNYRSVHDFIDAYTSTNFFRPSSELSIHINKLLMKRITDEWELGKLRVFSEKPNPIYDTWYSHRDFYPNLKPKQHLDTVYNWITDSKIRINKLIQLPILLYEFIDKAPMAIGNQITGILSVSATAKEFGYNPRNIIPFAKAVSNISEDLVSAYKISKSKKDLTVFIEAFLYTLSLTAMDVENLYTDVYQNKVKKYNKLEDSLNPRQTKILEYLEVEKKVTRKEYTKIMGTSFMTSFRDLQELVEKGYIVQKGVGRGTYYVLSKKIEKEDERKVPLKVFK